MTKPVVAVAAFVLVEECRLRLEAMAELGMGAGAPEPQVPPEPDE